MSKRLYTLLKRMLQKPLIPNGADLNDYLTPGKYRLNPLSNYTNVPSGHDAYSAYMKVHRQYNPTSSKYTEQRLTLGDNYLTFVRRWDGTAWSTWATYAGSRDLIVKQGTSGIWTYRKWASGLAECWGTSASITTGTLAKSGSIYYKNGIKLATLPTGLFTTVSIVLGTQKSSDSIGWLSYVKVSGNDIKANFNREQSSATNIVVDIYVKGFWKESAKLSGGGYFVKLIGGGSHAAV